MIKSNIFLEKHLTELRKLPKDALNYIVYKLMSEDRISFTDIIQLYTEHLKDLKEKASEEYWELHSKTVHTFYDYKKNRDKNLKDIMHWMLDKGKLSTTHENIDKHR